jgi:SpoVK/Ycf46/Vps4 family AAA+-type ATPase
LYVQTWEEDRLLQEVLAVAQDERLMRRRRAVFIWNMTAGLRQVHQSPEPDSTDPMRLLAFVESYDEPALFLLCDFHWYFRPGRTQTDQRVIRRIKELGPSLNRGNQPKTVVFVAPTLILPDDLQKDINVIDFGLPNEEAIRRVLRRIIDENQGGKVLIDLTVDDEERLVKAALGLTLQEADNAFARAMAEDNRLDRSDIAVVMDEKRQAIKKTEVLEYIDHDQTFEEIGGLEYLKQWLAKRRRAWLDAAQVYGLPFPKGVLITGVPGCGKSLTAKCTSALWELPLLRLDVGRIFAGIVGSSEHNMRTAIKTAEAIAPCILWIDEIEKGFSHSAGGNLDSGVSSRVFGTFLTWLQEKRKPVFVIATANNISVLPPEFLRKGRFDEIFFIDLPTRTERVGIFRIHLESRLRDPRVCGDFPLASAAYQHFADLSEGFSGAEIEQAVISALFEAYANDRSVEMLDLQHALAATVPLSKTQAEQVRAIRDWANLRAVAATAHDDPTRWAEDDASHQVVPIRGGRTIEF